MSEQDTVAIVITTYNHARYLGEAIDSVLAQTVPADEIIVVDDGSTDDPASVVARYPAVRLIRQDNQGLSAARNTGLHAASSRFIAFLDADDRLTPRMIEVDLAQFRDNPACGFVYGAYCYVDEAGVRTATPALRAAGADAYGSFLVSNIVGMHGTVLYRRDRLLEAGGFDPALRAAEDYDVYLRMSRSAPVAASTEVLAEYRRHDSNMSNDPAFMLDKVLAVHSRHEAAAAERPEWRRAYEAGRAGWAQYYAKGQLARLREALKTPAEAGREIERTGRMALKWPRAMASVSARAVRKRAGTRMRVPRFGDLDRVTPISHSFGYDRGKPVDRHYVEAFLARNASDIRGRVLEIGDASYTREYGGSAVEQADVLNRYPGHPETTFVGDLSTGGGLPDDAFDCIVLTQTLHLIFDMRAAVATLHRVLKPGGVLLITVPWASPIDRGEWGADWFWSISPQALTRLLSEAFGPGAARIDALGNVKVATAFLYGLAEHELRPSDYDHHDPHCPVIVAGRAVKRGTPA